MLTKISHFLKNQVINILKYKVTYSSPGTLYIKAYVCLCIRTLMAEYPDARPERAFAHHFRRSKGLFLLKPPSYHALRNRLLK